MAVNNRYRTGEDWIDNTLIREAVVKAVNEGMSWNEIAIRAGWPRVDKNSKSKGQGETTVLKRRIGLATDSKTRHLTRQVRYDIAVRICEAIYREPWELDL